MRQITIRKSGFLVNWLFWSVAVWAVAVVAIFPGSALLMMATGFFMLNGAMVNLLMGMYIGGVLGLVAGYLQHCLMKQYFFVTDKDWYRWSALAGILAGLVVVAGNEGLLWLAQRIYCQGETYCYAMYGQSVYTLLNNLLPMTVFIGMVSVAQWAVLRRYVDDGWLWVLANLVGGIVFAMLLNSQDSSGGWLGAVLAQGAVTGVILLWLFLHRAQPLETPAATAVSVWDEAI